VHVNNPLGRAARTEPGDPGIAGARRSIREVFLSAGNIGLKGIIFPWLLLRLRARANYNREVEPFIGFVASILFGILALGLSAWLALELTAALKQAPFGMLESSIFLIFVGLFLIISRRKALMQVIGYLVLENGIFVFGVITVVGTPLLVELGVLLDAFVAVFVMGNRDIPHQSRIRVDGRRSAQRSEGLRPCWRIIRY